MQHLDIFDRRRTEEFANAQCADCDYYLAGRHCEAEKFLLGLILAAMLESDPDAAIPGISIKPNSDDSASLCPGLWPSSEYIEELKRNDTAAWAQWREDMQRRQEMGRKDI